uniref:POB3_N domain-containing protein n=1 Tax=Caenorhabditis tropicalis TaxID=1561998 RepID=A0A1I7UL60_9PELO
MSSLEFSKVFIENIGVLTSGTIKLDGNAITFKADIGSKTVKLSRSNVTELRFQKLGNKPGLRVALDDGGSQRFGGFKDEDLEKINEFANVNWQMNIINTELVIKGWNYGQVEVKGRNIEFSWEKIQFLKFPVPMFPNV